jgi:4-azaleucine resistance transporter AzlC
MKTPTPESTPLKLAFPIMLGWLPIAMSFGLLGSQLHLSLLVTCCFSLFIFAGASQFAVLGLMAQGPPSLLTVFITVGLINLRHVIFSMTYYPLTQGWTYFQKLRFFSVLTDESYAVLMTTDQLKRNPHLAFRTSILCYLTWQTGTFVGHISGNLIPNPERFGLDFALCGLFVGIISLFIDSIEQLIGVIIASVSVILLQGYLDLGRMNAVVATLIGSGIAWRVSCRSR